MDPYMMALDLKDRYVRFLDGQGRLSYRGDVNEFKHTLAPDTHLEFGEELGKGSYARVQAVYLVDSRGSRTELVRRIHDMVPVAHLEAKIEDARRACAGSDGALSAEGRTLKEALRSLPPEMHAPIKERIRQDRAKGQALALAQLPALKDEYRTEIQAAAGQFGRILGISLDAGLEDAIAPIIGFGFEAPAAGRSPVFTLYQFREGTTLQQELRNAMHLLTKNAPEGATMIADLVDATCALVGRTGAAGYIDADLKSENIGVTRKPDGRGYAVRTIDIGELRPVGALRDTFERHIATHPEDAEFLPTYLTGSLGYMTARKLDAFATRNPTPHQLMMLPGDDRTALALTLANDLFGLYAANRDGSAMPEPPERQILRARCAFLDPKAAQTVHPALAPYRACIERAIAADIAGSEYATGAFLQDLRTASGDVRAYARRTQ